MNPALDLNLPMRLPRSRQSKTAGMKPFLWTWIVLNVVSSLQSALRRGWPPGIDSAVEGEPELMATDRRLPASRGNVS
jgi:hypothetical protein